VNQTLSSSMKMPTTALASLGGEGGDPAVVGEPGEGFGLCSKQYERHVVAEQSALSIAFLCFGCANRDGGVILNVARVVSVSQPYAACGN
jgi:hypothetical protein